MTSGGDTCCAAAVQHQGIELGVCAVYPSRKHLTPKVRLLIDFLVEAFRTRAWPA